MEPQRKLRYLNALELDVWVPREVLPGAKSGEVFARRPAAAAAVQSVHAAAQPGSSAQPEQPSLAPQKAQARVERASNPGFNAVRESLEAAGKPPPVRQTVAPQDQASEGSSAASLEASSSQRPSKGSAESSPSPGTKPLALFLLNCPGRLLLVDSSANSREQQHLMRNMMFALTAVKPGNYQPIPFDSGSASGAGGNAEDILRGIVERSTAEGGAGVLLMGAAAQQAFACSVEPGQIASLSGFSGQVSAVVTHSAAELLQNPALKAQTWAHAQGLVNAALT